MEFTHINENNDPVMVNVANKNITQREAVAKGYVYLPEEVLAKFEDGDIQSKKGPVFHTAMIAATMGVKKTSELIPFCHPISIESCEVKIHLASDRHVEITCTVGCSGKTGVEMEALTGVHIAALTVYDMCKALSQKMVIQDIGLVKKTGGKSDINHEN